MHNILTHRHSVSLLPMQPPSPSLSLPKMHHVPNGSPCCVTACCQNNLLFCFSSSLPMHACFNGMSSYIYIFPMLPCPYNLPLFLFLSSDAQSLLPIQSPLSPSWCIYSEDACMHIATFCLLASLLPIRALRFYRRGGIIVVVHDGWGFDSLELVEYELIWIFIDWKWGVKCSRV